MISALQQNATRKILSQDGHFLDGFSPVREGEEWLAEKSAFSPHHRPIPLYVPLSVMGEYHLLESSPCEGEMKSIDKIGYIDELMFPNIWTKPITRFNRQSELYSRSIYLLTNFLCISRCLWLSVYMYHIYTYT